MAYEAVIALPKAQRSVAASLIVAQREACLAFKRSGSDEDLKAYEAATAAAEAAEAVLFPE